ncbi:MAG: hypothetical protein P8J37_22325 [Fuerstiella sp.]|nr:hypothetical protein [Fuerstiella sp.]
MHDWTVMTGVQVYSPDFPKAAAVAGTDKPELALQYLLRQKRPALACFRGLAPFTSQPVVRRLIKDYVQQADGSRECLLLMDEDSLHPRIQRLAVPWRPGLPDKEPCQRHLPQNQT